MFPVFLNLTGQLAVVIGGGRSGRRKAHSLRAAGASVRLVCLEPRPAEETDAGLEWLTEPFAPRHLDGARLVFACASAGVNERVIAEAHSRGLWVCCAGEPESGDFHTAAVVRRGDLVIGVGTGGAAPAVARHVRQVLEEQFDEVWGQWLALLRQMRALVRQRVSDVGKRREVLERLSDPAWLARLRSEGSEAVGEAMRRVVESATRGMES